MSAPEPQISTITVTSVLALVVNGSPVGSVADAVINFRHALDRGKIQQALVDYEQSILAENAALKAGDVQTVAVDEGVKVWPNTEYFIAEFTQPEMAAIALSMHPTIAAMRLLLSAWHSTVRGDDVRVIAGLDALESGGILTPERRALIVSIPSA